MLFKDIVAKRFSLFSRMGEEKRNAQIDAIKYIFMIASTSGISVSNWDHHEVFGVTKGAANEIITDKIDINKRFFERVESLEKVSINTPSASLTELIKDNIDRIGRRHLASLIANAENEANRWCCSAADYMNSVDSSLKRAAGARATISKLTGSELKIAEQVQALHEGSFWEYDSFDADSNIIMITKNNVICSHKNLAAGIDISVDMGKFTARYNMQNAQIKVNPYRDNISVGEYYHPHISHNCSVCWGNAGDAASRAIASFNLTAVYTLLASVLVNYNPDNPYRPLEEFYKTAQAKIKDSIEKCGERCPDCDWEVDDCTCEKSNCAAPRQGVNNDE